MGNYCNAWVKNKRPRCNIFLKALTIKADGKKFLAHELRSKMGGKKISNARICPPNGIDPESTGGAAATGGTFGEYDR
jgi:hypothetical protein